MISYSVFPTASDRVYLNDAKAESFSSALSNAEADQEALRYKNSHKCYSTLFLNQCVYGNEDTDRAMGTCKNPDKGDDIADKCGDCCQAGGEEESEEGEQGDGEVERHSVAINICRHQNLALLALQPPQWRRWRREGLRRSGRGLLPHRGWKPGAEIQRLCQGRNPWRDTVGSR